MSSFLCRWFGIGCPKPPTPPAPQPPTTPLKPIAIVVFDGAKPLAGASVSLDGSGVIYPLTNGDGYTIQNVPTSLGASQLYVNATGFEPYSVHVDLPKLGGDLVVGGKARPDQIQCEPLKSKGYDPSNISLQDLSRIRGAMWSVRGPWRFGPRPGSPDNITALEFLPEYGDSLNPHALSDEQKAMIATYKGLGYTHVATGPPNGTSYHNQYPSTNFLDSPERFEIYLDWLQVFWDNGLAPICFLHQDGDNYEQTVALYEPLLRNNPKAQKLMRIIVPTGWEPTRYDWSSVTWAKFCAWGRDILPNALVLIHTVADVDAPVGTDALYDDNMKPDGNGMGWSRVAPYLHGWLIQNGDASTGAYNWPPKDSPAHDQGMGFAAQFRSDGVGAEAHSAAWHFKNGILSWPTSSAWGPNTTLKLYNGECTAYCAYWRNLPYADCAAWGDLAVANGADGYLDSGSVSIGGPVPWQP